jgi:tetratricopeptide (TPR) repeat protein
LSLAAGFSFRATRQWHRITTAVARWRGGRFLFSISLFSFATAALAGVPDDPLSRVHVLARGGAAQLALKIIEREQPRDGQADNWIDWEKERYSLYWTQKDWSAIAKRVANLPSGVPEPFVRWAQTTAARARLQAGDGESARVLLRPLLWGGAGNNEEQVEWRQLVIRSYLVDGKTDDAVTAVDRYRADFNANSVAWRQFEAGVMIRAGRAAEVYQKIGDIKTHEGQLLMLLAGLRGKQLLPADVVTRAQALAEETGNQAALSLQAWMLMAEAAQRAGNSERRIFALERALSLTRTNPLFESPLKATAEDLWSAYDRYADAVGNDAQLLVGNDDAWLKKAASYKRDDAMKARAFYAFLMTHAANDETRKLAIQRLADSLFEDGRAEVLRELFSDNKRWSGVAAIPEIVRFRLADQALKDYDIDFAAKMIEGMETPPAGEDPAAWTLRRARVAIYAGKSRDAVSLLSGVVKGEGKLSDDFANRLLQVLFDLQGAGRHAEAIELLQILFDRVDNVRTQREILYWIGESQAARGEHQQASELYLRSAFYRNPTGGDMWGQTARFHAAEELGKAGLTQDARLVFQALLKHTDDAKQRAIIERSIQQLWLTEKKAMTP